jgi:hypothetical protein
MNLKNITGTVRLDTKEVEQDFRKLARQFTDIADSIKKDREKEGYKAGTDGAELEADGDVTIYPMVDKLDCPAAGFDYRTGTDDEITAYELDFISPECFAKIHQEIYDKGYIQVGERQYSINKELLDFGTTKDQHGIDKSSNASML